MRKPKIVIFECGCSGGGGFMSEKMIEAVEKNILSAEIVAIVSNYGDGGVRSTADKKGINFIHFPKPWWTSENYQKIATDTNADFFILAGWFIPILGLDPATKFSSKTVIDIYPGPITPQGDKCPCGHHIHESVVKAFKKNEIEETEINMFFVEEEVNNRLVFAKVKIPINPNETSKTLRVRVKHYEYLYQPKIANLVVNGMISWDGINHSSLEIPPMYSIVQ